MIEVSPAREQPLHERSFAGPLITTLIPSSNNARDPMRRDGSNRDCVVDRHFTPLFLRWSTHFAHFDLARVAKCE